MLGIVTSVEPSSNVLYFASVVDRYPLWHQYRKWLNEAKPGDKFIYFSGLTPSESLIGGRIAQAIRKDAEKGLVILLRRRVREYLYDYYAVKSSENIPRKLIPNKG